jgi:hypothetical protein
VEWLIDVPLEYVKVETEYMSASKLGHEDLLQPVMVEAQTTRLNLPASAVKIRKNGIEFRTGSSIPAWTEMTVVLQTPFESKKFHATGVVVACHGTRHAGYTVSMVFTGLSRQAQARLHSLAFSTLGGIPALG